MAVVLMVLAVPLSKLRPRQGRFARVGLAVLVYFVYSNLLATVRVWIEKESPGGQFGLWWVHLLPLLVAAWLLWREERPGPLWRRARGARPDHGQARHVHRAHRARLHAAGDAGAARARRAVSVHRPAGRHRHRQLQRDAGVAVRRVEPAELPVPVAARRRVDRCAARPRQPGARQRIDRHARIGRDDGAVLPLAGGGRSRDCAARCSRSANTWRRRSASTRGR